jgi:uncharacterized protein YxeA
MKKIIVNILAVIFLFIIILVIVTINSPKYKKDTSSDLNFVGPASDPADIVGPQGPPPSN